MPKYPERIAVEYFKHGRRTARIFDSYYLAKRFYIQKCIAGRKPKIRKVKDE